MLKLEWLINVNPSTKLENCTQSEVQSDVLSMGRCQLWKLYNQRAPASENNTHKYVKIYSSVMSA